MTNELEQELQTYNTLLNLWQAENPIKTIKLQFLLATNAALVGFFALADGKVILLAASGVLLNIIWTLSIGRTSLFQKAWKNKLDEVAQRHPEDARFQILQLQSAEAKAPAWLKFLGGVSSKYYLLGAPVAMGVAWLVLLINNLH
jgi:hypothetical protein